MRPVGASTGRRPTKTTSIAAARASGLRRRRSRAVARVAPPVEAEPVSDLSSLGDVLAGMSGPLADRLAGVSPPRGA